MISLSRLTLQRCIATLALSGCAVLSQAASISGLKNTGADSAAGAQDLNYSLSTTSGTTVITGGRGWDAATINPLWAVNDATSQWLTPLQNGEASLDPAVTSVYTWKLSFDLTGFDEATATFAARYRTDNAGTVLLNGTNLGANILPPGNFAGGNPWTAFSALAGSGLFQAGINVITFTVQNDAQLEGNPSGLRVEFDSSNVVTAVPEPEALGLALAGLGVLSAFTLRRRSSKQV
jgi:PEP-CTERM motif